ncbi:ABC transporter ATP-binding protein [Thalassotalea hakodatensis]|uniref:ABC transporter ATP-binding protein n=1 Tax=Thalassotalea hakodatensis TaxID=3030492 RepID=UPI002572A03F|nr:ABC transporter ATP-binding protein [Thalassotalea hakodatensis]
MLRIEELTKAFNDNYALQQLSLNIEPGEIYCLLGSNGAGKSTTLNLLLGFLKADSGHIYIDEKLVDVNQKHSLATARDKIAYIPEQVNLYPQFNAMENLAYLANLGGIKPAYEQFEQALTQTGLAKNMWHKPLKDYSKGMRQKVGIAFAILRQAKLLLLDEPTSGLDPSATQEFIHIIDNLAQQGAAVLMVTHDLECSTTLGDKFAILKEGEVIEQFSQKDLASVPLHQRYQQSIYPQPINLSA